MDESDTRLLQAQRISTPGYRKPAVTRHEARLVKPVHLCKMKIGLTATGGRPVLAAGGADAVLKSLNCTRRQAWQTPCSKLNRR